MQTVHSVIEVDGQRAVIHVRNLLVTNEHGSRDYFVPFRERTEEFLQRELDEKGQSLVRKLSQVEGVVRLGVGSYVVTISFGPAFDWESEIRPHVDEISHDVLGYNSKKKE